MQLVDLKPLGLVTKPNPLGLPPGAMTEAKNVVLEREGLIQSRRGFSRLAHQLGGAIGKMFAFDGKLWANHGSTTEQTGISYDTGAAWTALAGTYTNQFITRVAAALAGKNCFVTTDEGVRRIEKTSYAVGFAGGVKAIGIDKSGPAALLTGAPGVVLADGRQAAYRVLFYAEDSSGTPIYGAPSSRCIVSNASWSTGYGAGVTKNVVVRVLLPKLNGTASSALTTSYYYRVYRSKHVATTVQPSDDLRLAYEAKLTSTDITNGYAEFTDSTPDSQLGDFIYTAPNNGDVEGINGASGILQSNEPPQRAKDACQWRDRLWIANLTGRQFLDLTILSVAAGVGLSVGDTITIAGTVYTAVVGAPATAAEFKVETAGTATQNIEGTALNLVQAINKTAGNTSVWAFYLSGPDELPGKIRLEARTLSAGSFNTVASAHGGAYRPAITADVASDQDIFANGYGYSKWRQPDAFPLVNYERAGADGCTLDRIFPLRDSLFFFTTQGLYRMTGTGPDDFDLQLFDESFKLIARETIAVVDDALYAWGYQGVARIDESGLRYISEDIEPSLLEEIRRVGLTGISKLSFAVGYQSDHKYELWTAYRDIDKEAAVAHVLDTRTGRWTTKQFPDIGGQPDGRSCGLVNPADDLLYYGDANNGDSYVFKERKARAASDYQDTLSDGTTVAIQHAVTWAVQSARNPAAAKHWREVALLWGAAQPASCSISISSEIDTTGATGTISTNSAKLSRVNVPQGAARSARLSIRLTHETIQEGIDVAGLSVSYREYGPKVMR